MDFSRLVCYASLTIYPYAMYALAAYLSRPYLPNIAHLLTYLIPFCESVRCHRCESVLHAVSHCPHWLQMDTACHKLYQPGLASKTGDCVCVPCLVDHSGLQSRHSSSQNTAHASKNSLFSATLSLDLLGQMDRNVTLPTLRCH